MKTWNDYKEHVKTIDSRSRKDIENAENLAAIVSTLIEQRNALGISQRELAAICGMSQSSIVRIESMETAPRLDTLLKIMRPLGLRLTVSYMK